MNRREFSLSLLAAIPAVAVSARAQQSSAKLRIKRGASEYTFNRTRSVWQNS